MPVPGVPKNLTMGKIALQTAIECSMPKELHPEKRKEERHSLLIHELVGPVVEVLYSPNSVAAGQGIRAAQVFIRDFPGTVQVLTCNDSLDDEVQKLIAHLKDTGKFRVQEIREIPKGFYGQGNIPESSY